ncbi:MULTISPECIES: thiol reductant ABC exporter subunit CydD [unclassified Saccharibacter]|uniref:thiol reductant ABC exporter subunit CydD n=1 Tax=unclassified Saccharibacter TaxID=2648722 RepID=UPI00132343C8|nr:MULTISPECIES: thiol reductant ABC exporter subunit CydD [unclassified Saccharibacter]MXV36956.1 thiol reductant ABC exporter subunit CydD [Saccharibacter sp. EH611]MXV58554.1 thiol reductant ABC exporter subunit CydD [Saccharibacter sp. EH70]MXV66060.1 thiol reductant ABC exporter subunit CydD [Saccharibacter sp. EH60]
MTARLHARAPQTLSRLTRLAAVPLAGSVILGGGGAVFLIAQMGILAQIITDLAFRHHHALNELLYAGLLIGCVVLRALCQGSGDMLGDYAGQTVTSSLRMEAMEHLFRVGPVGLAGQDSGRIATLLSEGIEALHSYISRYMTRAAAMLVTPLLILAMVAKLDGWSLLILAITGPLIPLFMALVGYSAQSLMDRKWTELLLLGASFLDTLQGLTTLRLFGRTRDGLTILAHQTRAHRRSTMAVMRVAFLTSAVLEFFSSLSIALVAVLFGARLLNGTVAFQEAFFVLLLAPEFFMPLRSFSASYHDRQNAQSAFTPIAELFTLPPLCQADCPSSTSAPLQSVQLDKLCAGYGDEPDVLHSLSAHFNRNQLTVITGPSGSGKTTLLRVLLGMMPLRSGQANAQRADGTHCPLESLTIGWVPQSPFLLAGTIADNLRLAAPHATEDALQDVVQQAGMSDIIATLPEGLQTSLGERGAPLSAGQIRRLALARALLRAPQLLLFDEPTADLDAANAAHVADAIAQASSGRVCIVIAHRSDLTRYAQQTLTLSNGSWTQTGAVS